MEIAVANRTKENERRRKINDRIHLNINEFYHLPDCNDQKIDTLKISNRLWIGIIIEEISGIFNLNNWKINVVIVFSSTY